MTIDYVDCVFVDETAFHKTVFIGQVEALVVLGNYCNEFFRGALRCECPMQDSSLLLGYNRLGFEGAEFASVVILYSVSSTLEKDSPFSLITIFFIASLLFAIRLH